MMNLSCFTNIAVMAPFIIAILIFFFRIERRLTTIETYLSWIKKAQNPCQQSLEKITP